MGQIEIKLNKNYTAIIDESDYDLVKDYNWTRTKNKDRYYAIAYLRLGPKKYKRIWMHRLIMDVVNMDYKTTMIDHINHNCLDNRRSNLRICTNQENQRNSKNHKDSKNIYKGIYWRESRKRYEIRVSINGKRIYLGFSKDLNKAIDIYNSKVKSVYGEFAYIHKKD